MKSRYSIFFILLSAIFLQPGFVNAQETEEIAAKKWTAEVNGYINFLSVNSFENLDAIFSDQLLHNRLNLKIYSGSYITGALELRNRLIWGSSVSMLPDYVQQLKNPDQMDLSLVIMEKNAAVLLTEIDRMNLTYQSEKWAVTLGRQRINWGKNLLWNANDLFNMYNFFDFDYTERPGTDAIRIQRFFTGNSGLELAADYLKHKKNTVALKYNFHVGNYDLQVLTARYAEDFTMGIGWEGSLGNLGTKGEVSYFVPPAKNEEKNTMIASLSFDYYFKNGLSTYFGVLFNNNGIKSTENYNPGEMFTYHPSAKNPMPNRWTFFTQWSKSPTPALSTSFTAMYAHELKSVFFIPQISYSIAQNWDFDVLSYLYYGKEQEEIENLGNTVVFRFRWSF